MQSVSAASVSTREIDFVALRTRRTGRAPSPAVVPLTPPAGFTLAGVKHTETFAISRFTAASPTTVSSTALRRLEGEAEAEVILER